MNKKTAIQKNTKVTPKAMMDELDVDFISLVKQGANKQPFKMFKSNEKTNVEKNPLMDIAQAPSIGSSFTGAMEAINTAEKLEESRNTLEESFFVLKMVIKGVLEDNEVTDKSKGLKKAAGEFADFVGKLFDGISVQKASEMLNMEDSMKVKKTEDGNSEVEKAGKDGGVSSNGQPDGKNRKSPDTKVKGVSKNGMQKMLESAIVKTTEEIEGLMAEDFTGNADKIAKAEKNMEALQTELEKAVGDRTEGSPTTGEDTVTKNGNDANTKETHDDSETADNTGDTSGAVAKKKGDEEEDGKGKPFGGKKAPPFKKKDDKEVKKEDEASESENKDGVEKNTTVGSTNPDTSSAQDVAGKVGNVNEKNGNLTLGAFEKFMQTFKVSLDGKISAQSDLIKNQGEKIERLERGHRKVDSLTKMAGLSNAQDLDFTISEEKVATQKSEDTEWSQATSGNGSLKINGNNKRS